MNQSAMPEWDECQRISDLPAVDEAIRGLLADPTGDNATDVVRQIRRAIADTPQEESWPGFFQREFGAAPPVLPLPPESPELLREAAAILAGDKPMRFPIVDELVGLACMLAEAARQGAKP